MIRVRPAASTDAAELLDLIHAHARFEGAQASVTNVDLIYLLDADGPPTHIALAEEASQLLGYGALTFDYALWSATRFAYLDCLFVSQEHRGKGVGKALVDFMVSLGEAGGAARLEWQTPSWNVDAVRFYEGQGATGQPKVRFSLPIKQKGPELVVQI